MRLLSLCFVEILLEMLMYWRVHCAVHGCTNVASAGMRRSDRFLAGFRLA